MTAAEPPDGIVGESAQGRRAALLCALQTTFERDISLARAIGLSVVSYDGAELVLAAPLALNTNHKATAFAGSLNAVLTLAGWGLLWLVLAERELPGLIVIQESRIHYRVPVCDDFTARCHLPDPAEILRIETTLRRKGKARLDLEAEIRTRDAAAVQFAGRYVIHAPTSATGSACPL